MTAFDTVIVGSGINSLVCGALLALRRQRICVLERSATLGGCIRTEELTAPGFRHDTLSTLYPLFVSAPHFPLLEKPLAAHGATFCNSATPTAVLTADGRSLVFHRNREQNVATLEALRVGDGLSYRKAMEGIERSAALTFGLLGGELWTADTAKLLARQAWTAGPQVLSQYFGDAMQSCRAWLDQSFQSELARALFAPWVLHVGLGPESAASALMGKLVLFTLEQFGSPMVVGGSSHIVAALVKIIEGAGGEVHSNADVEQVLVADKTARGVKLSDGRTLTAHRAVVCNVTPTQLYDRLLPWDNIPQPIAQRAAAYRYGRGEMQIHLALDELPQWPDEQLAHVAMLHVTPGLDGVSRAVNEAERGLLPAEATIVVAQPVALDSTRAPPGQHIFWIQLQELPSRIKGDAAGELHCPADGAWSPDIRERYADRIVQRLCTQIPNLSRSIIGRKVLSPADLESLNVNLVGGDPYCGSCELDQFLLWRPFPGARNHETPVRRLYHIGASTHPGPGLGGMSGYMVAQRI